MMLAQAKVMKLFHNMVPEGKIGPALNLTAMYPATCNPMMRLPLTTGKYFAVGTLSMFVHLENTTLWHGLT